MRKAVGLKVGLGFVVAATLLGGCADAVRRESLADPTPAQMGPVTTAAQVNNGIAHTADTNLRLMWDDMGRFWLFDRPSHLTPYPIK
ncbi:MAG: hypothetical protein Q8L55_12130 [Phycisphaerales bacterium]|nr:hypothetical protein [Phycisphaerales bacterium]